MNIRERFVYFQTLLIFKCIHGQAPNYLTNNVIMDIEIRKVPNRSHNMNLYLPFPESEFYKNILFYRGARDWNVLPDQLKNCNNLDIFKKKLKLFIKSKR